jgi:hypothetical protein
MASEQAGADRMFICRKVRMYRFWKILTLPLLDAQKPKVVVEIGSQHGPNTKLLCQFCAENNAVLHTIDPEHTFEVSDILKGHDEVLYMYKDLSLDALPSIHNIDAVLIDGDHNWYTVYHELTTLADQAKQDGRPLPMVLFHDASWPYARRDLYYNPATIPEEFRHEYAKKGLIPDEKGTSDSVFNNHLYNALFEGGEKNGVLTAVEDFISESNENIYLHVIPAFYGYGILVSELRLALCPELQRAFSDLLSSETLLPMIESLEKDRIKVLIDLTQKNVEIARRKDAEIAKKDAEKNRAIAEKEKAVAEKNRANHRYREELYSVYTSRSWRYTAPARKIGNLIRRLSRLLHKPWIRAVIKRAYFLLPPLIRNSRFVENHKNRFKSRETIS